MLTGTVTTETAFEAGGDLRAQIPRFASDALAHNLGLVEQVKAIAAAKGVTPARSPSRGCSRSGWIVPIPGTTKPHRLAENAAAADVVLTPAEVSALTAAADSVEIQGGRYPDHLEAQTNL
ncbi:MAG: hypothetical protein HZY73_12110 [Micropruina sp.]|nr:MAG: hypothetical protein HZY73_12110 [Micropruina sp.]